jgi:lysophospholipase
MPNMELHNNEDLPRRHFSWRRIGPRSKGYIRRVFDVINSLGSTPNGTYAPGYVECPSNFGLRPANGLSPNETAWLSKRRENIINALTSYLPLANLTDFNTTQYILNITANASYVPTSAFAFSGGGYVSCLNGLGAYQAIDARYPPAISARTGGLAQCLTYIAGLSGGSVAVSTLASNNYPTLAELVLEWDPTVSIFTGPNASNLTDYYGAIFESVGEKAEMGFNVSLSDVLGRLFSFEFVEGTNGGINKTFSDIQVYPIH